MSDWTGFPFVTSRWRWCLWNLLLSTTTTSWACSRNQVCIGQRVHVHINHSEGFVSSLWSVCDVHRALCMRRNVCVCLCVYAWALIWVDVETLAWKCFVFWTRNKEKCGVCMYSLSTCKCVCVCVCVWVCVLHVWESLLRSGAMEHHIVVVRGWDDDCFVCSSGCSVVTARSRLRLYWHTHAYRDMYSTCSGTHRNPLGTGLFHKSIDIQ